MYEWNGMICKGSLHYAVCNFILTLFMNLNMVVPYEILYEGKKFMTNTPINHSVAKGSLNYIWSSCLVEFMNVSMRCIIYFIIIE